ncbi:MAG: DUF2513 domain-containing protein [Oceanicaulis sp.]
MKRDMDLIRYIMLRAEGVPSTDIVDWVSEDFPKYDFRDVYGHVKLLMEGGFMTEVQQTLGLEDVTPGHLTWAGHDLLDAIRDDAIWRETKSVANEAGGFTIDLLKQIAVGLLKTKLKKHTGVEL